MKNPKLLYAVAALLALLAGLAVYRYQTDIDARNEAGSHPVTVAVAAQDIAAGTSLKSAVSQGQIRFEKYPAKTVPTDSVTAIRGKGNLVLTRALPRGSIITDASLGTSANPNPQLQVPAGMQAVTIALDEAAKVSSYTAPGSRVVVYWLPQTGGTVSVLIPEVSVLAVGSTSTVNPTGGVQPTGNSSMLTLALSPADAPRLVLAGRSGEIYLGLLGSGGVPKQGATVRLSDLSRGVLK